MCGIQAGLFCYCFHCMLFSSNNNISILLIFLFLRFLILQFKFYRFLFYKFLIYIWISFYRFRSADLLYWGRLRNWINLIDKCVYSPNTLSISSMFSVPVTSHFPKNTSMTLCVCVCVCRCGGEKCNSHCSAKLCVSDWCLPHSVLYPVIPPLPHLLLIIYSYSHALTATMTYTFSGQ